jgi:putative oxidoreductase
MRLRSLFGSHAITLILRFVVGGAFVFAGVLKMADPAKFAIDVSHYRLLPHEMIHLVAIFVPGVEVVAGLFVLAGFRLKAAALVITGLTVIFFAVIVSALARGLNIECGCFGTVGGKHIGLVNLAIDSTLFCLAALLVKRAEGWSPPLAETSAISPARRHESMF